MVKLRLQLSGEMLKCGKGCDFVLEVEEVEEEGLVCNKRRLRMRKREGRGAAEANAGGIGGEGKAKPTVVALGLLGQLGLVDLVLPVAHLDDDDQAPLPRPVQPLLLLRHPLRRSMIGCSVT